MPFASKAQERFMFAKHPEIAKRWAQETDNIKSLPEHVKPSKERMMEAMKKVANQQDSNG